MVISHAKYTITERGEPLKTIVVANQKGGVGKTTLARHLAFYGAEQGLNVLAVDLDVQGNFSTTLKNIASRNKLDTEGDGLAASGLFDPNDKRMPLKSAEHLHYIASDSGIVLLEREDLKHIIKAGKQQISRLNPVFDVCVIDTGPAVSSLLVAALAIGNFAISPCKPDRDAIAGLMNFFSNVTRVKDNGTFNPELSSLGVLPNQVIKGRSHHTDALAQMRKAFGAIVLPFQLYERAAIDIAKDRAVWRTERGESRGQAAIEMKQVCNYIYKRMGLEKKKNG